MMVHRCRAQCRHSCCLWRLSGWISIICNIHLGPNYRQSIWTVHPWSEDRGRPPAGKSNCNWELRTLTEMSLHPGDYEENKTLQPLTDLRTDQWRNYSLLSETSRHISSVLKFKEPLLKRIIIRGYILHHPTDISSDTAVTSRAFQNLMKLTEPDISCSHNDWICVFHVNWFFCSSKDEADF